MLRVLHSWWRVVSRLACVGVIRAVLAWRAVSWLAFVVASHAVLTWRAGEGGGLILPALAKSAPTLPSPPRHPGTARCAALRVEAQTEDANGFFSVFRCGHVVTRRWKRVAGRQLLLAVGGARPPACGGSA